jgi:TolA-binding protein
VVTQAQRHVRANPLRPAARREIAARLLTTGPGAPVAQAWRRAVAGAAAAAVVIAAVVLGVRGRVHQPRTASVAASAPAAAAPAPGQTAAAPAARHARGGLEAARAAAPAAALGPSRAAIRAIGAARFTRVQTAPDDVVRLDHGAIVLEVSPLAAGERFRVRTDDAEVEVRGTRFEVSADEGKLMAVSVSSGRVEVRSPDGGHVVLEPGDEWVRGAEQPAGGTRAPTPAHATPPRAAAARANVRTPPPRQAAPPSFVRAWSLLRQGSAREAAALFAEVERTAADPGIAEDALYWRAVATTKAGERAQAEALFERFLRSFPSSSRAGEAAAALGWLYVDSGQLVEARRAFERAADDPSAAVRTSARDGLRRAAGP